MLKVNKVQNQTSKQIKLGVRTIEQSKTAKNLLTMTNQSL